MYVSHGFLRYSPKLLGDRVSEKYWLVLDCDPEIGSYYRKLYNMDCHRCNPFLSKPAWKEHITVVRNEEPTNKDLWEKYANKSVEFKYNFSANTNGIYWWLDVECVQLLDLREELGLPRNPLIPLHLSFGHIT